jgi:membrane associated rhomboid family serine protease
VTWSVKPAVAAIGLLVAAWWAVELADFYVLDNTLQTHGIRPRELGGLDGIIWAPFLHSDFGHLISNTFPFIVLSALVLIRGFRYWLVLTSLGWIVGGLLTWSLASGGNHIGASGVVFTYFGALLAGALFERRAAAMAPALVTLLLYTTMLVGLVPQERISWEGHLAGFAVGVLVAGISVMRSGSTPRGKAHANPEVSEVFGDAEPWLD